MTEKSQRIIIIKLELSEEDIDVIISSDTIHVTIDSYDGRVESEGEILSLTSEIK